MQYANKQMWTNAAILSVRPQGTYCSEILFEIQKFSFKEMQFKIATFLSWPQCYMFYICVNLNNCTASG